MDEIKSKFIAFLLAHSEFEYLGIKKKEEEIKLKYTESCVNDFEHVKIVKIL